MFVVVGAEVVELVLELVDCSGRWSGAEPSFEGLMESFDFALGLWVAWGAVLLFRA